MVSKTVQAPHRAADKTNMRSQHLFVLLQLFVSIQRRFVAVHLMRIGRWGVAEGGSHTTSLRNSCFAMYFTRPFQTGVNTYLSHTGAGTAVHAPALQHCWSMRRRWETNTLKGKRQQADIMSTAAIMTIFQSDWLRGRENSDRVLTDHQ